MVENQNLYTKGDRDDVIRRYENVFLLTLYCPIIDEGVKWLRSNLSTLLNSYMEDSNTFLEIPVSDLFLCFMNTTKLCREEGIDVNVLYSICGVIQSFKNLKYLNIKFTEDEEVLEAYDYLRGNDKKDIFEVIQKVYKIEILEFILGNMFTQNIVDMLNQVFIFNEIISNNYLEREFLMLEYVHEIIIFPLCFYLVPAFACRL